jgi:transketolase
MIDKFELTNNEICELAEKSLKIRESILAMIHNANSGHTGGSLSCVELLTVLYFKCLKQDKSWVNLPLWKERDRFVLSKGHASAALYAVLAEAGYFDKSELQTFRKLHSKLQGHPSYNLVPGIEASTGSLGMGLSIANGMALGLRLDGMKSRVYVLMGDGELQEGQIWEAAMSSSHYKLNNITAIVDRNGLQIDGQTECIKALNPLGDKWKAFGWEVIEIEGHNFSEIYAALKKSAVIGEEKNAPVVIIAKTVKGKGVPFMENLPCWHGKAPDDEEYKLAMKQLGCKKG